MNFLDFCPYCIYKMNRNFNLFRRRLKMKKRMIEKVIFIIIFLLMVGSIISFSFPKPLSPIIVCGVWYEPLPITAHDFIYESNCCIVLPSQK